MSAEGGVPIYGPMLDVRLFDIHDAPLGSNWRPYNTEALELASCLEACKKLLELAPVFNGSISNRSLVVLSTDVLSLSEHVLALQKRLVNRDRSHWPEHDQLAFIKVSRSLRKQMKTLERVRSRIGAHCDADVLAGREPVPPVSPGVVLAPFGESLSVLVLALNHAATFHYIRQPNPDRPNEVQLMVEYPFATLFRVDVGRVKEVLAIQIAADPRGEAIEVAKSAVDFYNALACRAERPLRGIVLTPFEDERSKAKFDDRNRIVRARVL